MSFLKKNNVSNRKEFLAGQNFENDIQHMYKQSEKRAWLIAGGSAFLVVIFSIVLFVILPLKEVTPYVIQVNEKTGIPDVLTIVDPVQMSTNEALNKYFVNKYVQSRESYTYQTIQKGYVETQLFSNENVKSQYLAFMNSKEAPDTLMNKGTITVKVKTIILERIQGLDMATVRIASTYTTEKDITYIRNFLVKLTYEYLPKQKVKLSYRLENPLGFQVTSYQITEENI